MRGIKDRATFETDLEAFKEQRGMQNMKVPMIGGKALDLYTLFTAVIKRGGAENVSLKKLWKEIVNEFELPPSCTSASFTLKNHYIKYLLSYEQIVHFGKNESQVVRELGPQRSRLRDNIYPTRGDRGIEHVPEVQNTRSDSNLNLQDHLNRLYSDKAKNSEEVFYINRSSLVPSANEIKRLILAFDSMSQPEVRFTLNSLMIYSCSKNSPFAIENYRVLYASLIRYFGQLKTSLEKTRYILNPKEPLRDENLVSLVETKKSSFRRPPISCSDLLEQFKMILTIFRNLLALGTNEEFLSKDTKAHEMFFDIFLNANESEIARLSFEIIATLSRYVLLKTKNTEEEKRFLDKVIDSLISESDFQLGIETLHNLMVSQENEAVLENELERFVQVLIKHLISDSTEIVERVLEILCHFSDLKVQTRMLLARQPHFFSRLIALIAGGSSKNAEKMSKYCGIIINNIIVTSAAKVYLKPFEKELFTICTVEESVSDIFSNVLLQLKDDKEKDRDILKTHNRNFYEKYINGDFFCNSTSEKPANEVSI